MLFCDVTENYDLLEKVPLTINAYSFGFYIFTPLSLGVTV